MPDLVPQEPRQDAQGESKKWPAASEDEQQELAQRWRFGLSLEFGPVALEFGPVALEFGPAEQAMEFGLEEA